MGKNLSTTCLEEISQKGSTYTHKNVNYETDNTALYDFEKILA